MKRILLSIMTISSLSAFGQSWNLNGNAGTNPNTQFIGTTDAKDLVFKTNNNEKLRITSNGRLLVGYEGQDILIGYSEKNRRMSSSSVGIGDYALDENNGRENVAIGLYALPANTQGIENTALGSYTLYGLSYYTSRGNTAVGTGSLAGLIKGSNNVGIGNYVGGGLTSGDENILIGNKVRTPFVVNGVASKQLNIGDWIVGNNGIIGIGKFLQPLPSEVNGNNKFRLFVKDGIRAELVQVDVASTNNWADYVFEEDYKLMPLLEVEKFVQANKHLPNIPSAEEVVKEGINLAEMNAKLLEKIEELTLYTIEQEKRIQALEAKSAN